MTKHTFALATLLASNLICYNAHAAIVDYADVISSKPIYSQIQRQQCDTQAQTYPQQGGRSYVGAAIGGIAGGILGNQVGGGNGRTVATAAGAVVGAIVGDNIDNRTTQTQSTQPTCQTVVDEQLVGYDVTYKYNGLVDIVRMRNQPSSRIKVVITPQLSH